MSRTCYRAEIEAAAIKYGLSADVVEALVVIESAGHADAFRYEAGFFSQYMKPNSAWQWTVANPRRYSASYGLCQVLFVRAWELGLRGEPEELFKPAVSLEFGCRNLSSLLAWADKQAPTLPSRVRLHSALAAYNGGRFRNEPDEIEDRNTGYADRILSLVASQP